MRAPLGVVTVSLEGLDVLRLEPFGSFYDVELNRLPFLQAAESVGLDGGEVYEDILATLAADKAEALSVVEPLDCSLFHCVVAFLF